MKQSLVLLDNYLRKHKIPYGFCANVHDEWQIEVRKEDGCECLDILVDPQSKNTVVLYEIWRDLASQLAHLETKGFANWKAFSDPLIENFSVKTLESGE